MPLLREPFFQGLWQLMRSPGTGGAAAAGMRKGAPNVTVPWVNKLPPPWPSVPANQQLVVDLFSANVGSLPGKDEALRGW